MLYGEESMNRIFASRVAVFGIGGVGGYVVEALCRTGVGSIDIYDSDIITITNLNRQIIATHKSLGAYKVDVMKERIHEINPMARIGAFKLFYGPDTADDVDLSIYDYVIDAVDTVAAKLELVCRAKAAGIAIISSMGAANKTDAAAFKAADIYRTSVCPLARVMRKELRNRGIETLKVVYSEEIPKFSNLDPEQGRPIPASNAFVPAAAGLIIAGEVIKDLMARADVCKKAKK
jgi:tRNA A37 threonylcarbamoyladenosine dehydratase